MHTETDIQDDDYVITDCGRLGADYHCLQVGEHGDFDDLIDAILIDMDRQQFWPSVWYVNDHGNVEPVSLEE